jgi:hypothetical protein
MKRSWEKIIPHDRHHRQKRWGFPEFRTISIACELSHDLEHCPAPFALAGAPAFFGVLLLS